MKIKTSITISQDLLQVIDQVVGSHKNRSSFLEKAAWEYIAKLRRAQRNARDFEIINQHADAMNAEVMDALSYQVGL